MVSGSCVQKILMTTSMKYALDMSHRLVKQQVTPPSFIILQDMLLVLAVSMEIPIFTLSVEDQEMEALERYT